MPIEPSKFTNISRENLPPEKSGGEADASGLSSRMAMKEAVQTLHRLAKMVEQSDVHDALMYALNVTNSFIGSDILMIYSAEPNLPQLKRIADCGSCDPFPDYLPSTELIRLSALTCWRPGDKTHSELYRIAKGIGAKFLVTAALGQEGAWFGLLVVGDTNQDVNEEMIDVIQLMADQISIAIQYFILISNLHSQIDRQQELLLIRNTFLEYLKEGVLVLDDHLQITEMNASAEWMLGYTQGEAINQPVENILIGADSLPVSLENARLGMSVHNLGRITLHRRDGQSFPAHIQIIPVVNDKSPTAILVFIADISENEQNQMRTQQLEHRAVLGEVIAIFAHEVRNPINNLSTGLQLLQSKLEPNDTKQELINRMQVDCQRLNHLMESVLAFSRPIEPKFEDLDIGELLKRVMDRWRPRFVRDKIAPFFQMADGVPRVKGDPRSLEQVFINLISNAVNAMGKTGGGSLAIAVVKDDSIPNHLQVAITVSDTGPGIPDELKPRLFEPFVTTSSSGTGLGLAITKRIVTAHHGSIKVDSFPGGTMFTVFLSAADGA